ncbi:hypothetical protein D3C80_1733110 [compost metagenome]
MRELICYPAIALIKIARIKGMNISIDNPLIPKELLEVNKVEYINSLPFIEY